MYTYWYHAKESFSGNIDDIEIGSFNLLAIILGSLVIFGAAKRP
jgi:hypothetical protein